MINLRQILLYLSLTLCVSHDSLASSDITDLKLNGNLLQGSLVRGMVEPGSHLRLDGKPLAIASNGAFVMGFSRDSKLEHLLELTSRTGEQTAYTLHLNKREYRIQRIDGLDQNKVTPPESVLERIRSDAALVRQARTGLSVHNSFEQGFIWPSVGQVTGIYGSQRILNGKPSRPHYGIDLAAAKGTDVVAPAAGKITMAHPDLYYSGGTIIIDHGLGVFSTFLHMSQLTVKEGEWVEQGALIGAVGSTGRSTGPHLDWRINWESMRLDPGLLVPARDGLDYTKAD